MLTPDQQAAYLANCLAECAQFNGDMKTFYLNGFNALVASVVAHGIDPSTINWPTPPNGFAPSAPDKDGFVYATPGLGAPVCTQPPIPTVPQNPVLVANTIDIGANLGGGWYAAGPRDTWPPNKNTPPVQLPDGSTHVFLKIPAPVGSHQITLPDGTVVINGGWYEVVG